MAKSLGVTCRVRATGLFQSSKFYLVGRGQQPPARARPERGLGEPQHGSTGDFVGVRRGVLWGAVGFVAGAGLEPRLPHLRVAGGDRFGGELLRISVALGDLSERAAQAVVFGERGLGRILPSSRVSVRFGMAKSLGVTCRVRATGLFQSSKFYLVGRGQQPPARARPERGLGEPQHGSTGDFVGVRRGVLWGAVGFVAGAGLEPRLPHLRVAGGDRFGGELLRISVALGDLSERAAQAVVFGERGLGLVALAGREQLGGDLELQQGRERDKAAPAIVAGRSLGSTRSLSRISR